METGIQIEVIWSDQDLIEVIFSCSNNCFSGSAELYLSHEDLPELAESLRGFPRDPSDSRYFELGTFDPSHADGGARINFVCRDHKGHAIVEVRLRGDGCKALGDFESVALKIPIEPAGVDCFERNC